MSEAQKQASAEAALALIEPGMRLGLGTGSTAEYLVRGLGARVARFENHARTSGSDGQCERTARR